MLERIPYRHELTALTLAAGTLSAASCGHGISDNHPENGGRWFLEVECPSGYSPGIEPAKATAHHQYTMDVNCTSKSNGSLPDQPPKLLEQIQPDKAEPKHEIIVHYQYEPDDPSNADMDINRTTGRLTLSHIVDAPAVDIINR